MPRLFKSFTYAFRGLIKAWREERNLQIHSVVAIIIIVASFVFQIKPWEWCAVLLCIALVVVMEFINSVVERLADMLKPRINIYIKEIKDIMAAATFVSALFSATVGLIIFVPHIWGYFLF
jgi:diacylglycerol kinase